MESEKDFLSDIFYYLPPRIRAFFLKLPPNICDEITEIRLRADKPVSKRLCVYNFGRKNELYLFG